MCVRVGGVVLCPVMCVRGLVYLRIDTVIYLCVVMFRVTFVCGCVRWRRSVSENWTLQRRRSNAFWIPGLESSSPPRLVYAHGEGGGTWGFDRVDVCWTVCVS